jgi:Putative Ig domain
MRGSDRLSSTSPTTGVLRRCALAITLLVGGVVAFGAGSSSAATTTSRVDLRVLLLDDNSPWVDAIESEMQVEGVPYTTVALGSAARPVITDAFLSSGDRAFFQAVVGPDAVLGSLTAAELTSLRAYEAKFGIREVDAFNYPNVTLGLNTPAVVGDINGTTATVTAAGKTSGFGYLNGPVPFSIGSYSYIAEPLAAASMPAGASYTTLVGAPLPSGATGSLLGVYSNAGVEQLIISAAFSFSLPQYKTLAHGIISWATRGVHFGYNRNNLTFHVDDAFSSDALWNSDANCTPGEDCAPGSTAPEASARMTPDDVAYAVAWEAANNYQLTLAFNGFYADPADQLTQSLVASAPAFRWLNHGFEHLYQGCVQDFTVSPWRCTVDANGQIVYMSQADIYNEIQNNINTGKALGLTFDATEYLSGEHSGLFFNPQQPLDNPNFAAALTQAGIKYIASDASRDNSSRQVGSAITVPRHPTALYYNTSTQAAAVDEYNWLYTTRADGGSGYCEDNPTTATCIAPLDPATGFTSYIAPSDAKFDLGFILSNDPRPFYAHVTNMTGDRLLYPLLGTILSTYRAAFTPATPLVNLTLTQAATALARQTKWATTDIAAVSGYVQNGQITVTNPGAVPVPITAPTGTTIAGATLESYGGEVSGWLNSGTTTVTPIPSVLTVTGSTAFVVGKAGTVNIAATGTPAPTITLAGALPAGLAFTATPGAGVITGSPAVGTSGSYPLTVTSVYGASTQTKLVTLTVTQAPAFTSAATATASPSAALSFTVTTTGSPVATITRAGTLPTGITFVAAANGTARLSGTPTAAMAGRTFPLTFTATNSAGTATQAFTLTVGAAPAFTTAATATAKAGSAFTFTVITSGSPVARITLTGALPTGVTFVAGTNGTARLSGTPTAAMAGRTFPLTFTASNSLGTTTQAFTLTVSGAAPTFSGSTIGVAFSGRAYSFVVQTAGSPVAAITMTGVLPRGVTFVDNHNGTATLSGTPARGASQVYTLVFKATTVYGTATRTFLLLVIS